MIFPSAESSSMLEVRHLRTLLALTEAGTVSRAAERVHLTQSALSHQLKTLEAHYGVATVKRHGQSVKLTEPGQRLVALARTVMGEVRTAERDLTKLVRKPAGTLRIVLECHTCFDWLMPIMDAFRKHWPEVELDLVSGFHPNPIALLADGKTDLVIGSENKPRRGIVFHPLFRFEVLAVLPTDHRFREKRYLSAGDFARETLITYPVPEERIDLIRRVLKPAGVRPKRRTPALTGAILQLGPSRRGVAALPNWGIKNYVDYKYVIARSIGRNGLWSNLHGATTAEMARQPFIRDFLETARRACFSRLDGVVPVQKTGESSPLRFFPQFHPPHGDRSDVAFAQARARRLVIAFQRARGDGQGRTEGFGFLDHRPQVLAHGVDVDGDSADVLALERRGERRPACFQH